MGENWRKAGYAGYLTGGAFGVQPLLDAEDKYSDKGKDYSALLIAKHAAPTAIGASGGAYIGRKIARKMYLKGLDRVRHGLPPGSNAALVAAAVAPTIAGGLIGNHYARKLIESDTQKLSSNDPEIRFSDITLRQAKDRINKQSFIEANITGHATSALTGGLAGMAAGGLLLGRRGVIKGGAIGAAGGLLARATLQPGINRSEDEFLSKKRQSLNDELRMIGKHAGANLTIPALAIGSGIGLVAGGKFFRRAAKNAGRRARVYKRAFDISRGKPVPMKPGDYRNIVSEQRPIAMLPRYTNMSAKEELNSIIQFAGGYVKTEDGIQKERGVGPHFNRAAGRYIGALIPGWPITLPAGYFIDRSRKKRNLIKTDLEPVVPPWMAKGKPIAMSAIEFARGSQILKLVKKGILGADEYQIARNRAAWNSRNILSGELKTLREAKRKTMGTGRLFERQELDEILFACKKKMIKLKAKGKCPDCGKPMAKCNCDHSYAAKLESITFAFDPRPRDNLGMFSGESGEPGTDPNAIHVAYKMPMMAQQGPPQAPEEEESPGALKKLLAKLKGKKQEMSAREELNTICFDYWNGVSDYNPDLIKKNLGKIAIGGGGLAIGGGLYAGGGKLLGKGLKTWAKPAIDKAGQAWEKHINPALNKAGEAWDYWRRPKNWKYLSSRDELNSIIQFGYWDDENDRRQYPNDGREPGHFPVYGLAGGAIGAAAGGYMGARLPGQINKYISSPGYQRRSAALARLEKRGASLGPKGGGAYRDYALKARRYGRSTLGAAGRLKWRGKGLLGIGGALAGAWLGSSLGGQLDDASA